MKLVTTEQMRAIEAACEERGISSAQLMDAAGLAVAQEGWIALGVLIDRVVLLLCGPGNNGGDTLVAARSLREWGADVRAYLVGDRPDDDPRLAGAREAGATVVRQSDDPGEGTLRQWLGESELVVDGILGTGQHLPLRENVVAVLQALAETRGTRPRPRLVAVDVPTGVDADSGAADPSTVEADGTVALGFAKVGLYALPGSRFTGRIEVVDIGIPGDLAADVKLELLDRRWARNRVPARPSDANKGTFGRLLVVAGSPEYRGAAALVARGAQRSGVGLVTLAAANDVVAAVAAQSPETTFLPLGPAWPAPGAADAILAGAGDFDVAVVGPGLSKRHGMHDFVLRLLERWPAGRPVVLDADALNVLADTDGFPSRLPPNAVLTPHPGEMARLTGLPLAELQAHRSTVALDHARAWNTVVVLKGSNTVVAAGDGRLQLAPFATAALASAGTGDVLAGVIGSFIAQGMEPFDAAVLAVYVHGKAGEALVEELGVAGVLASDVAAELPKVLKLLATEAS